MGVHVVWFAQDTPDRLIQWQHLAELFKLLVTSNNTSSVAIHTINTGEKLLEHNQPGKQLFHEQKSTATNKPHLSHPKKEKKIPTQSQPQPTLKQKTSSVFFSKKKKKTSFFEENKRNQRIQQTTTCLFYRH